MKIVANAGGINTVACVEALKEACKRAGVEMKIASVTGDDMMPLRSQLIAGEPVKIQEMSTGIIKIDNKLTINDILKYKNMIKTLKNIKKNITEFRNITETLQNHYRKGGNAPDFLFLYFFVTFVIFVKYFFVKYFFVNIFCIF